MIQYRGGFYADVRVEERFVSNVRYVNDNLTECKQTAIKKAFLRVFDGALWYYCSTDDLDNIQAELDKLYACAKPNPGVLQHPVVKKFEINKDSKIRFANTCVKDVDLEKKRDFIDKRRQFVKSDEYLKMAGANYSDRYSLYRFTSSLGADVEYDVQLVRASVSVSLAYGKESFDNVLIRGAETFDKLKITKDELTKFMQESDDFLIKARSVEPGAYPVILSPTVAGIFAHESFGHKSEADFMIGDETMKKEWAIGKRVASDLLSIYDCGDDAGAGYVPYDDEGTKSKKTYLIKNGILSGRLHSAKTAADLEEDCTGNARAVNCDFEPIVRMTSTVIESGDGGTLEDLAARIKFGYYIKSCKHGSGMSTFTIAPSIAYRIENGKITCPVKIALLTGNVFETLGRIDGVGSECIVDIEGGTCGKMEQYPLSVSFGGPYVSVSKMNVQ